MSTDASGEASFSQLAAKINAEGGYEENEAVTPIRVSGILSLVLGFASLLCLLGLPLVLFPIASLGLGAFAMRSYNGPKPIGISLARIGMILAVLFGSTGLTVWGMRQSLLSSQAEEFAMNYLSVMAEGESEIAMELKRPFYSRTDAPLREYYKSNAKAGEQIVELRVKGVFAEISKSSIGSDPDWKVSRTTKLWRNYGGTEKAEVCLVDRQGRVKSEYQIFLTMLRDRENNLQWSVDHIKIYSELLVAEGLL